VHVLLQVDHDLDHHDTAEKVQQLLRLVPDNFLCGVAQVAMPRGNFDLHTRLLVASTFLPIGERQRPRWKRAPRLARRGSCLAFQVRIRILTPKNFFFNARIKNDVRRSIANSQRYSLERSQWSATMLSSRAGEVDVSAPTTTTLLTAADLLAMTDDGV